MLVQPVSFAPHRVRLSTQVDASLVDSVVSTGVAREDLVSDVREQMPGWSRALEFVQEHDWKLKSDPASAVWVYQIGDPEKGFQRATFTRRDGDMLLDTVDPGFSQRIVMDLRGNVQANSGKKPRP